MVAKVMTPAGDAQYVSRNKVHVANVTAYDVPVESLCRQRHSKKVLD